jgi:hypothetical protein
MRHRIIDAALHRLETPPCFLGFFQLLKKCSSVAMCFCIVSPPENFSSQNLGI